MHPFNLPIVADENIRQEVVAFLRNAGVQIESIKERNLRGLGDEQIVSLAEAENKVILTHDADFGRIMHSTPAMKTGIIYLRPGHFDYTVDIQTLQTLKATEISVEIPFIVVAERSGEEIKIRVRNL